MYGVFPLERVKIRWTGRNSLRQRKNKAEKIKQEWSRSTQSWMLVQINSIISLTLFSCSWSFNCCKGLLAKILFDWSTNRVLQTLVTILYYIGKVEKKLLEIYRKYSIISDRSESCFPYLTFTRVVANINTESTRFTIVVEDDREENSYPKSLGRSIKSNEKLLLLFLLIMQKHSISTFLRNIPDLNVTNVISIIVQHCF